MIKNVDPNATVRFQNLDVQTESRPEKETKSVAVSVSDKIEISNEAKTTSQTSQTNKQASIRPSERSQLFADVFLANFKTHGLKEAFDIATAAVRSKFSVDSDFHGFSSEESDDSIEKILKEYDITGVTSRTAENSGTDTESKSVESAEKTPDSLDTYY